MAEDERKEERSYATHRGDNMRAGGKLRKLGKPGKRRYLDRRECRASRGILQKVLLLVPASRSALDQFDRWVAGGP